MAYNPNPALVQAIRRVPRQFQAVLLATALAESGGRLDAVGDGGRSHGPYQEYDFGRGSGIPIAQRRDPVASTQRALREFQTFYQRGARGAELAYRAQRPADQAGYIAKINQLLPVAQRLLGGGGSPQSGGQQTADPGAVPPQSPGVSLPPGAGGQLDTQALMRLLNQTRQGVLRGEMPTKQYGTQLSRLVRDALPRAQAQQSVQAVGNQAEQAGGRVNLQAGGGWAGSQALAEQIAKVSGLPVTSTTRDRRLTASGNPSDHWTGSTNSYAVDLGATGAKGDTAFRRIVTALGYPNLQPGQWHNLNIGGYRYQIGWRTPGHHDHVHVGVKRI